VALPFTLKSILRQKKKYGNSNISFKKAPKETQNPSRYYLGLFITKSQVSTQAKNIIFQYKNRPILLSRGPKSIKLLYSIYNEA
jgi:hypothetical protein